MFDKLKKAFSGAAKSIGQKEISEKDLDNILLDLQLALLESDVAQEVVDSLSSRLKSDLLGLKLEKDQTSEEVIKAKLQTAVAEMFARAGHLDIVEKIREKKAAKKGPFVIVFLGINGTGKTTSVAKMANLLRKNGLSLVLAAGDTHRAGAIEQLTEHANRLSMKVVHQRYGADPSSVGRDAIDHARKNYIDAVLVDTAGRMQTSKNLMDEMGKIVRVVKPDVKIFVGDSLAGNDTINQAKEFFQYTNFDGAILTKIDADAKGGAALSIVHITSKPIAYIGVGQGYDDLVPFDPDKFIESVFGSGAVSVESIAGSIEQSPEQELPRAEEQQPPKTIEKEAHLSSAAPISSWGAIGAATTTSGATTKPALDTNSVVKPQEQPNPEVLPATIAEKIVAPREGQKHQPLSISEDAASNLNRQQEPPVTKISEPNEQAQPKKEEKKGSRFGGLFGRKKKEEKETEDDDGKRGQKNGETRNDDLETKKKNKSDDNSNSLDGDEKKQDEHQQDKVVYLTDEDIEDLLK